MAKPCRTPLQYSIGNIDPRFNISGDQLKKIVGEAENIWESEARLNMFEYNPGASLRVHLVYDERQAATNAVDSLQAGLEVLDSQRNSVDKQQSALSNEYDQKLKAFKTALAAYQDNLQKYNKDVTDWNKQGGASEDEFRKLEKRKSGLEEDFSNLKKEEKELNDLAGKTNTLVDKEKAIVNSYNNAVTTYKSKYGGTQEFEKGIFDPSAGIIIYQFKEASDLELTLIHELGHALGIGHVENPKSIMYYMIGEQDLDNPKFTNEDIAALKKTCQLE
ncbi:MAG TPA: matrixin family metalloprotease [Patescibacteria group bacterium]